MPDGKQKNELAEFFGAGSRKKNAGMAQSKKSCPQGTYIYNTIFFPFCLCFLQSFPGKSINIFMNTMPNLIFSFVPLLFPKKDSIMNTFPEC